MSRLFYDKTQKNLFFLEFFCFLLVKEPKSAKKALYLCLKTAFRLKKQPADIEIIGRFKHVDFQKIDAASSLLISLDTEQQYAQHSHEP